MPVGDPPAELKRDSGTASSSGGGGGGGGGGVYVITDATGGSSIPSQIGSLLRFGSDSTTLGGDGRVLTSSSLATPGRGRQALAMIGIEQVITKTLGSGSGTVRQDNPTTLSLSASHARLTRSSSLFDMNAGRLPKPFGTPLQAGTLKFFSLEFRPPFLNSPNLGFADPLLSSSTWGASERNLLPQSTIYNWSCGHFSRPLLTAANDNEETLTRREQRENFALDRIARCQHSSVSKLDNRIGSWDTKFESGTKAVLLQPFSPVLIAADDAEMIRIWNYEEHTLLNSFDNHNFPDKGICKLCLLNELDDSLLLVASSDGNIRIWKDYTLRGKQKLVTAFSSIQGPRPGSCIVNVVVDWQQQSGYLYVSGDKSIMLWDLGTEQLVNSIPSSSETCISALSASQVNGGQLVAGYIDGSVRLFDIRTPEMLVCTTQPHRQKVERVVGIGFQPGLDPGKIVSASQAGDIQFLDMRNNTDAYLTIEAHRGLLTALAIHRHAPIIASGSAKQLVNLYSLDGSTVKYCSTYMTKKIGSVSCLAFHPYQFLLAAGGADGCVSIYADDSSRAR